MLIRRVAITSAAQVVQAAVSAVSLVLLARVLAPADFAIVILLTSAVVLLTVLFSAGPQASLLVMAARSFPSLARMHGQAAALSVAIAAVTTIAAPALSTSAALIMRDSLSPVLLTLTLHRLAPSVYGSLLTAQLMGAGRIPALAAVNIGFALSGLLSPLGAAIRPSDPLSGAVWGALGGTSLWAAFTIFIAVRNFGFALPVRGEEWRELFGIGLPLHVGSVAHWLMLRADLFMLGVFASGPMVGVYAFALSLSERVSVISAPLYAAVASELSAPGDRGAITRAIHLVRFHLLLAAALTTGAVLLGGPILTTLGGSEYGKGWLPFVLLTFGASILPVWSVVGLVLVSQFNASWLTSWIQVAVATMAIGLYVVLIPTVGIAGAALASAVAYCTLAGAGIGLFVSRSNITYRSLIPRVGRGRSAGSELPESS